MSVPLRVLHVTSYYAPAYAFGGVVSAVSTLTHTCAEIGLRVTVLTTDALNQQGGRVPSAYHDAQDGVTVIRLPNLLPILRGRYNLSTPHRLATTARRLLRDTDIVHLHEFRTVEALIVSRIACEMRIPLVLSPHGTLAQHTGRSGLKRLWDRWLSPAIAQRIAAAVVLSEQEAADTRTLWDTFWPRERALPVHILPNGVRPEDAELRAASENVPTFRARWGLGTDRVVLFVGRLHPRKGADVLIQAFLRADLPDTRLLIVGPDDGMLVALQAYADPRIVLTELLSPDDTAAAYACADLFVLPARGEGMPMSALEAMAAGLPVILSPECYLPQVGEFGAGLIVEPQVEPLWQALTDLMNDDDRRRIMGQRGQQLVRDQFDVRAVAQRLVRVYRDTLAMLK